MLSYKHIIRKIVILVSFISIFSLLFHLYYVNHMSKELSRFNLTLQELRTLKKYLFLIHIRFAILVVIVIVLVAFHDIGKVSIPDKILKKPGSLTSDEWAIMQTHSTIGGNIFASLKDSLQFFNKDFYLISENIARYHHEKWDGTGYPEGLSGKAIPLEARIVAIADVLDALTSKRVYKEAMSFHDAVNIIRSSAGTHLDPVLVAVFLEKTPVFEKIYNKYHNT